MIGTVPTVYINNVNEFQMQCARIIQDMYGIYTNTVMNFNSYFLYSCSINAFADPDNKGCSVIEECNYFNELHQDSLNTASTYSIF